MLTLPKSTNCISSSLFRIMNDMTDDSTSGEQLLHDLTEKALSGREVRSQFMYVSKPEEWKKAPPLHEILDVSLDELSHSARATLDALEELEYESVTWEDFRWHLTAYFEIQDVFDSPGFRPNPEENLFRIWYFYFESRQLLTESILCGLNALYTASDLLLRPFIEFNVTQLYFYRLSHRCQNYDALDKYLNDGILRNQSTLLSGAFPSDSFSKPIRFRMKKAMDGLSKSVIHPYHPRNSPRQHSSGALEPSLEGLFFWFQPLQALQSVLWAYYVNFPMLFHPRDVVRKFGFNSPVGLFVDETRAMAVQRTLSREDYAAFVAYSKGDETCKSRCEWYDSMPDLSAEEIEASWDAETDGNLGRIFPDGYAKMMSKIRAIRLGMALQARRNWNDDDEAVHEMSARIGSYAFWDKQHGMSKRNM
jgi:hypothetical protein